MLLNLVRNKMFWLLDAVKGFPIKNQLREIETCIEQANSEKAIQIKTKHLNRLLKHAANTTQYYKGLKKFTHVTDFPVIKKTTIQNNFEQFQSLAYKDKNNFKVSTSGSTGVPFFLFQDKGKRQRNHADVIYYFKKAGFSVGNRLYELEVWRGHNQKGRLKAWLQNAVQYDISRLTDQSIESFIALLKSDRESKKTLLGFASAFEKIAQFLERNNITLNPLGITAAVANSEYLNAYTKATLAKHMATVVLSRYSSEEIGIIAQQTLDSPDSFVINQASYHIELLQLNNDSPAPLGELGRIVVTDLFNFAMPIIRYDTGDIAKLDTNEEGIITFTHIEGRRMDLIYDTAGRLLSSFVVYTKFYKYYHLLKQYQFIQHDKKVYEIKLNLQEETFPYENELIDDVKSDFGNDADITITYVQEIPALASGKRRKVVNLCGEL